MVIVLYLNDSVGPKNSGITEAHFNPIIVSAITGTCETAEALTIPLNAFTAPMMSSRSFQRLPTLYVAAPPSQTLPRISELGRRGWV